ncbi:STAG domain-containing protein [Sphaerosporella brunnea]|uniref:STAG domain-containing protein n=1 Tax=Sphaerosporella brunnea TaxID=1250544 RepID=A0A5J5EFB5_9PEZI|nr:STAG domain-containing protein [Sphaerosporella brunnea]
MQNNLYGESPLSQPRDRQLILVPDSVFQDKANHDLVANKWIEQYQADNSDGLKELINFILKCCGCDNEIMYYDVDPEAVARAIADIQKSVTKQETAEYPLISKNEFRKFRQNLSSFLESFVSAIVSENLLLQDPALLETIRTWIETMSASVLRQFRHTSTVIALDLITRLAEWAAKVRRAEATTNRQLEAEEKQAIQNEGRIQDMTTKLKESEEKREKLDAIALDVFNSIFVHRYRDVDVKIRIDCIQALGEWTRILPDVFFDGQYIRYLGWVLSDTVASTRLEAIKALQKLFKAKDSVSSLRHFTERFKPRLVEMGSRDVDTTVRATTIELLDVVREVGFLSPDDIETIGRLLFDSEQKVRKAVVPFFVENLNDLYQEKLEELGGEEAIQESLDDEDDEQGPTLSWIKLKCLVETLATYDETDEGEENEDQSTGKSSSIVMKVNEIVSRFSLAGAALWETLDEVRDWEGLARYLLYDHSASKAGDDDIDDEDAKRKIKRAVALDAKEDVILLQILNASVTGSLVKGPEPPSKKNPKRTTKEIEKHKENVYRSLMTFIPLLLNKFGPVPDAASSVLRIQQLMNLDVFQELRQSAAYSSLLDEINRQFLTHSDEGVLKEASAALMHAKKFQDLEEVTESKLGQLKDETVNELGNIVRGKEPATAKFSDAIINAVRRLEHLLGIADCVEILETPFPAPADGDAVPVDVLLALLRRGITVNELEDELALHVLKALGFYFMWKVAGLNSARNGEIDDEDVDILIERRDKSAEAISTLLDKRKDANNVKVAAASMLLQLAATFAASSVPRLGELSKPLNKQAQDQIMAVFDALEKAHAKSQGKKLEPDEYAAPEDDEEEASQEDEDGTDESTPLMVEQRLCEFTSKIILAALGQVLDLKTWKKRLARNQLELGPNYKEVVNYLDRASVGRPGVRRGPQSKKAPQPPAQAKKSAETVVDSDEDEEEEPPAEEEEEGHEPHEEASEEEQGGTENDGSEPDPEVELPADEDEEMLDV